LLGHNQKDCQTGDRLADLGITCSKQRK